MGRSIAIRVLILTWCGERIAAQSGISPELAKELENLSGTFNPDFFSKLSETFQNFNPVFSGGDFSDAFEDPTLVPTASPTNAPSPVPTAFPTASPSASPTPSPTDRPTNKPTSAPDTEEPTASTLFVDPYPEPLNPPRGYFNYDPNSAYGPKNWAKVDTRDHWMKEFGPNGFGAWKDQVDFDPIENQCGLNERRQSPKDMDPTIECDAIHEIRTWCGAYGVSNDEYEAKILPYKLSLIMNRRQCLDIEDDRRCRLTQPPRADYPRYASAGTSYADMMHYDIKVPSEHTIKGRRYDAEVQMFHVHPVGARLSSIGVLIDASDDEDAFNLEFQEILDEFQEQYDRHETICSFRRDLQTLEDAADFEFTDHLRDLQSSSFSFANYELPDDLKTRIEDARQEINQAEPAPSKSPTSFPTSSPTSRPTDRPTERPTNRPTNVPPPPKKTSPQQRKFNPYSDALMPTIFFYRYNGSITEPPCKDITWWVMSEPMKISRGQLLQLQRILFTNIDPDNNCKPSSVHNAQQSVARPTFGLGSDREIQDCSAGSFKSDFEKFGGMAKKCRL